MRKSFGIGIFYTALSKYSSIVISILISAVLARLLTPEEFGIVAIVSVFTAFFNLLSNFGLSAAVVQNKSLTKLDNQSIFSFSIIFGLLLAVIFFLSAPLIASVYDDSRLIDLVHYMSLGIFLQSLVTVPHGLALKSLKFKQIGIISVLVHLSSGMVAIYFAYNGFGYYALVINSILTGLLTFIFFYFLEPIKISLRLRINSLKKIARFSTFQFLFSFINYFAINTDNLLIGKYFGTASLGIYSKAYQLMMMPVKNLTFVITPVLQPILSNYQDDKKIIYNAYFKLVKILAIIGFPLSVFLFFSASEIINIIYGSQWQDSIPIFKLLALTVGTQIVLSSTGSIFQATNRTDLLLYAGFVGSFVLLCGIGYGVFIGKTLESIGYGIIIGSTINIIQALYLLIKIDLKYSYFRFLKVFTFPLMSSLIIGVALFFTEPFFTSNIFISLTFKSILTLSIFIVLFILSKENRDLFNEYVGKRFKKNIT